MLARTEFDQTGEAVLSSPTSTLETAVKEQTAAIKENKTEEIKKAAERQTTAADNGGREHRNEHRAERPRPRCRLDRGDDKSVMEKSAEVDCFVRLHGWTFAEACREVCFDPADYRPGASPLWYLPTPADIARMRPTGQAVERLRRKRFGAIAEPIKPVG